MRFFKWLSKHTGGKSRASLIEETPGNSEDVQVVPYTPGELTGLIREHHESIAVLETSVNRIERKLNRWVELLGMKDIVKAAETAPDPGVEAAEGLAHPDAAVSPQLLEEQLAGYPGQETE